VTRYGEGHLDRILCLWEERFNPGSLTKREALFKWLSEGNPFAVAESPYFVLIHGNQVVGIHGHMPLMFTVQGKELKGYLAHDDLIATDYRGKGLGKFMLNGVAKQNRLFAGALWFNEPNYRSYRKSGWLDVPDFCSYVKILNPRTIAERMFTNQRCVDFASRLGRAVLMIRDKCRNPHCSAEIRIAEIGQFDHSFGRFYKSIAHSFGIMVIRDERYLNWKFVAKPFNCYKRFAAYDRTGGLSGYMILKKETPENAVQGKILDILADPEKPDVFVALISRAIQEFTKVSADYVEITCTYPLFTSLLRRHGFFRARTPQRFMVCNWEPYFTQDFVRSMKNWYLTGSDADGDAWSVDPPDAW
jgi:hypothetical protein